MLTAVLLIAALAQAEEVFLSPGEMKVFSLTLPEKKEKVYLCLTGRYQASGEGEWLQYHVSLLFNGVWLGEKEIVGSREIVYPRYGALTARGPRPRYDRQLRCFAFKLDNDFIVNNPPFLWDNPVPATTEGYSHTLVLDVTGLARPGENRLIVYNSSSFQEPRHGITGAFLMKTPFLSSTLPPAEGQAFPAYAPVWYYYQRYPLSLARYRAALREDIKPELKAEIAGSIGLYYLMRGQEKNAEKYFQASLSYSQKTEVTDEVKFRLLRLALKRDQREQAEKLASTLNPESSAFAGLALAYYQAFTGEKNTTSGRPVMVAALKQADICVDGLLDEPVWQSTEAQPVAQVVPGTPGKRSDSSWRVFYNSKGLCFAFEGRRPGSPIRPAPRQPKLNSPVWETNCFEVFLDPGCQADYYYELNIDDSSGVYHGKNRYLISALPDFKPDWQAAAFSSEERFSAEYFLPWSDLGINRRPHPGEIWGVNVIRVIVSLEENGRREEDYSWSPLRARNFHRVMDQGLLIFQ